MADRQSSNTGNNGHKSPVQNSDVPKKQVMTAAIRTAMITAVLPLSSTKTLIGIITLLHTAARTTSPSSSTTTSRVSGLLKTEGVVGSNPKP